MKKLLRLLLVALVVAGCGGGPTSGGRPAGKGDLDKLRIGMTSVFSGLEMYAHDHSLAYPDGLTVLVPKYLDAVPNDPINNQPLVYAKTERGYLISTTADYESAGAEAGFPQMDQDGFFALKAEDFPSSEIPAGEP